MMATGVQTVKLAIQHVRHHRQWMPISHTLWVKRPLNPFQIQALNDLRVLKHISVVIVVDESIPYGLATPTKWHPGENRQTPITDR